MAFCLLCRFRSADQREERYRAPLARLEGSLATITRPSEEAAKKLVDMYNATIREHVPGTPEWTVQVALGHIQGRHPPIFRQRLRDDDGRPQDSRGPDQGHPPTTPPADP